MKFTRVVISVATLAIFLLTTAAASAGRAALSVDCGKTRATLQCNSTSPVCKQTILRLRTGDGTMSKPSKPKGMERYTATGLTCVQAKDHASYLVVQFGELPQGCQFCEWLHVYTLQGGSLTSSEPPILRDDKRPEASVLAPNNKEFNALSKQLGLERPRLNFLK